MFFATLRSRSVSSRGVYLIFRFGRFFLVFFFSRLLLPRQGGVISLSEAESTSRFLRPSEPPLWA